MIKDLLCFALDLLRVVGLIAYSAVLIVLIVAFVFAVFGLLGAVVGTFFWAMFQVAFMF